MLPPLSPRPSGLRRAERPADASSASTSASPAAGPTVADVFTAPHPVPRAAGGMREVLLKLARRTPLPLEALLAPRVPVAGRAADLPASVSGGEGSLAPHLSLDMKGANYLNGTLRPWELARVGAVREDALEAPGRTYVGLEHAPTPEARAQLAFDEMLRKGDFERDNLLIIVPTSSGYVNPTTVGALEAGLGGRIASVVVQYYNRPAAFSTHKVGTGRDTYAALIELVAGELERRRSAGLSVPRLLGSGESMGAWVLTDATLRDGESGLAAAGFDRVLLVGTPGFSEFAGEVVGKASASQLAEQGITRFDSPGTLQSHGAPERADVFMLEHTEDPVVKLDWDLLVHEPAVWPEDRPFVPVRSFFSVARDVPSVSRMDPKKWTAPTGHFYDPELAEVANTAFAMGLSAEQLERTNDLLRERVGQGVGVSSTGLPNAPLRQD